MIFTGEYGRGSTNHGLFVVIGLMLLLYSTGLLAEDRQRLAYRVICADEQLAQLLSSGIVRRMVEAGVDVVERYPTAKLFVYANRDGNDSVNPEGVSLAVAHASILPVVAYALPRLKEGGEPDPMLTEMLQEDGFIRYMNVVHVDQATPDRIGLALDVVVAEFVKRYPLTRD